MSTAPRSPREPRPDPLPAVWLDLVVDLAPGVGTDGPGVDDESLTRRAARLLDREPTDAEWAALRSARGHIRALRHLERLAAPASLEGCVVASLEAGHRQDRAAAVLSAVDRIAAPAELDALVEAAIDRAASEHPAPAVLDRLVEERIAAPEAGTVRSMAARLGRKRAPSSLDERVLAGDLLGAGGPRPRVTAARLLAAGAAVLALVLTIRVMDGASTQPAPSGHKFTIVRLDPADAAALSPADRMFLESISGQMFGGSQ